MWASHAPGGATSFGFLVLGSGRVVRIGISGPCGEGCARCKTDSTKQSGKQGRLTMTIQRFENGPRMSRVVVHGDTVYLAGLTAEKNVGKSVGEQTQEIL